MHTIMMISFLKFLHLFNTVSAHAYIKTWSADGGEFENAQKQPLGNTAFRGVSKNTGWIGSKFIETPAITCGAEDTPKGKIAAPTASFLSYKSLSVKSGGEIDLVITGEPGKGFPHPNGHIQTYLGYCGAEANSCSNFDASKASYFKIQAELNAISEKLQLITFGQSSDQEGKQDQYYVYCGQIHITGSRTPAHDLSGFDSVQFPGAYKSGNIAQDHLPGPKTTAHELKHLAPSCSPEDFTCLCRSHKWTCAYVSCAEGNCKKKVKRQLTEVYSKCGAILSSRSRLSTTDYIPEHENPSSKEISKSQSYCVCKDHAAVCAWAKCAETNCQDNTDTIRLASDAIYEKCYKITSSPVRRNR
ncbi:family 61 glycoside hydrolase [Melampsora americana]|nr:family 61 glycoside hydrolase [Melampsora americana]